MRIILDLNRKSMMYKFGLEYVLRHLFFVSCVKESISKARKKIDKFHKTARLHFNLCQIFKILFL